MNHPTTSRLSASSKTARESRTQHNGALRKAAEEPPADSAGGFVAFLRTLPLTTALTTAVGLATLTVATVVAAMAPDPTAIARFAAYVALAVTALVGGIIAGRRNPAHPVLGALGAGAVFALLTALLALPVGHLVPAPDTAGIADSAPTVGLAVSAAQAACMRLGVAILHPVAAYLTRPRAGDGQEHVHHRTNGHTTRRSAGHTSGRAAGHSSARR